MQGKRRERRKSLQRSRRLSIASSRTLQGKLLPPETCDTLKTGDPSRKVTGIVTTFRSTFEVIKKARELGANLIITHEPTFYNHYDKVDWLQGDPVYETKRKLIEEGGIAIWRFHDYWHSAKPDGIIKGLARRLDLKQIDPENKRLYTISDVIFEELCRKCKALFGITRLMAVGDPRMLCGRVGVFAGWGGNFGQEHVEMLIRDGVDVVISGETAEWTGSVYVRDAITMGIKKGLIALGHAASERTRDGRRCPVARGAFSGREDRPPSGFFAISIRLRLGDKRVYFSGYEHGPHDSSVTHCGSSFDDVCRSEELSGSSV